MGELNMIFGNEVNLATILMLHEAGFEFVIEDGKISNMSFEGGE